MYDQRKSLSIFFLSKNHSLDPFSLRQKTSQQHFETDSVAPAFDRDEASQSLAQLGLEGPGLKLDFLINLGGPIGISQLSNKSLDI